jgi:hypothetical protein
VPPPAVNPDSLAFKLADNLVTSLHTVIIQKTHYLQEATAVVQQYIMVQIRLRKTRERSCLKVICVAVAFVFLGFFALFINGTIIKKSNNEFIWNTEHGIYTPFSSSAAMNSSIGEGTTQTFNNKPASSTSFLPDLHAIQSEKVWNCLLAEGEALNKHTPIHIMEVGMYSAGQCLQAAHMNIQAHCVEPSPGASYDRIIGAIKKAREESKEKVRFYQLAASDTSGLDLSFSSSGGTGDHVGGGIDVWKMTKEADSDVNKNTGTGTVTVKSVAIDDVIYNKVGPTEDFASTPRADGDKIDKLFLLKIDTQGHEPSVFAGLKKAIQEHNIDFIMTEYWPKGIDLMNDSMGPQECSKPVAMMKLLRDAGYTLYTQSITSHPKSKGKIGANKKAGMHNRGGKIQTPIDDLMAHCMWFYEVDRGNPDTSEENYQMGYWTDVLAVAPGARLPKKPVSEIGEILAKHL